MFDRYVRACVGASLVLLASTTFGVSVGFAQSAPAQGSTPASGSPAAQGSAPPAGAPAQPKVKDQGEYDALTAAQKETDPVKKLALLKAWEDKYPDSEFKNARTLQYMNVWSQIAAKTMATAPPTPDSLSAGKSAAQSMLDNLDKAFSSDAKPPAVTDDQWKQARGQIEQQAHMTLGWVALQNKEYPAAEDEFKKYVALNDQNAQVAYWLGTTILSEKNIAREPEALYQFARAVGISGPAALPDTAKKPAADYLAKAYAGYHGDATGLDDLKTAAAKSALPGPDFKLESVVEIQQREAGSADAYLAKNPDIKLWRNLKAALLAPDGDEYFTKNVKGTIIPETFKAKVVSWTPETNPTEIKVMIDQLEDKDFDAIIKSKTPIKSKIETGQNLELQGSAESFIKDPFSVTFGFEESKIKGLAAAPVTKRPVTHHRAAQ